ncbi:MAG: transposase [Candidatus Competibacteraceae bacterium]|nr:transposase [Candidatus Competibacteraceae bacterium]
MKEYVLNYFAHRVTTSVIEGINNLIKTVKRMWVYRISEFC